jgi:hypothetical protein
MFASIIIGFVGYALALIFALSFLAGLGGAALVSLEPRGYFARNEGGMTRFLLFVCGPLAIAMAALTRALI